MKKWLGFYDKNLFSYYFINSKFVAGKSRYRLTQDGEVCAVKFFVYRTYDNLNFMQLCWFNEDEIALIENYV